jgi:hypothetical protein
MGKMSAFILFLVLAGLIGGAGWLATWDIPAPVSTVEKVVPDERFPR